MEWMEIGGGDNGEESVIWDKSKTPELEGTFKGAQSNIGKHKSMLYSIETKDGLVKVWGSTVLDDRMLQVKAGAPVKIKYEGTKEGKNGEYASYRVWSK